MNFTTQSTSSEIHVAIIMDGNGRWALGRGMPRSAGHLAGARAVRRVVEAAPPLGIHTLTLYAFASRNWERPKTEIDNLMRLFMAHLRTENTEMRDQGVRLQIVGRRDRLDAPLLREIDRAEHATRAGENLQLRIAIDYSAREMLLGAARNLHTPEARTPVGFARVLGATMHLDASAPDVDLLIRTGGDQRLSDFLLWECAEAELLFIPTMWPDFTANDLAGAVADFRRRDRRFGRIHEEASRPPRHGVLQ